MHFDNRGYFAETFRQDIFEKNVGFRVQFVQENESKSSKGILRGLHYQLPPFAQSKLVRVIEGSVLDVVVDIRIQSKTFGKHVSVKLNSENNYQLFIPKGFAHGFIALSDNVKFNYKVDNYYAPNYERGIIYNDKRLNINWELPLEKLKVSNKDKSLPTLDYVTELFENNF